MSRLTLQHPALAANVVSAVNRELNAEPALRHPSLAQWRLPEKSFAASAGRELAQRLSDSHQVDACWQASVKTWSDFRLIAFDMDSTLITIECIDEMADYFGKKPEVAAITEAAMRGEITDYNESLRRRVALLAQMPADVMDRMYRERLRLTPGVEQLIRTAQRAGLKVLLVSGGFTFFANRLKERLSLDFARANELELAAGKLTGNLSGEIINAAVKKRIVQETCAQIGCLPAQAIVVGDGANDLQMMSVAGASIAYRAKPIVRQQAMYAINYCGLDAAVNFFD